VGKSGEGDPEAARGWLAKLRKLGQAGD